MLVLVFGTLLEWQLGSKEGVAGSRKAGRGGRREGLGCDNGSSSLGPSRCLRQLRSSQFDEEVRDVTYLGSRWERSRSKEAAVDWSD